MRHYCLSNGIPVVLAPMNGTAVMTALILFKVGSRNEQKANNGVSHFVEHLFFKGTERRPSTLAVAKELDQLGADYNAFTAKDHTGYYVKVASRHAAHALKVLADILLHPLFDAKEIDRERGVIVEEINMYEDNPMVTAEELVEELMFGKQHPLGFRITGPKKNIHSLRRADILQYRDTYYHPENMVIILAGHLPSATPKLLRGLFGGVAQSLKKIPPHTSFRMRSTAVTLHLQKEKTAQAHLAMGFHGPQYTAHDLPTAQVFSTILGGNMSSRLFINVRERQGLCYYIRSQLTPYEDSGAFMIAAGFDTQRIENAVRAIVQEIKDAVTQGVTPEELRNAKEFLVGKMSLRLEDSEEVAAWWGKTFFFARRMETPEQYLRHITRVTRQDVLRFARKTFHPKQCNLAIIGPTTSSTTQRLRRTLSW